VKELLMPILNCFVDDRTFSILTEYGQRNGRTVEDLAECAIAEAALHSIPPQARASAYGLKPDMHGEAPTANR
jgi:hypothetical protein